MHRIERLHASVTTRYIVVRKVRITSQTLRASQKPLVLGTLRRVRSTSRQAFPGRRNDAIRARAILRRHRNEYAQVHLMRAGRTCLYSTARIALIDASLAVELLTAKDALYFDLQQRFLCVTKPGRALAITGVFECS
ncbi:hypothetical protein [Dyella japonica]|uniref:hypothetical protein n=1 Tax=Dyella japonica TaxID=231455 RepID=UPI00138ECE84|nr:hypothetical protein [Dyella japonica]